METTVVKTEQEIQKAVKAMTMLFLAASHRAYSSLPSEEFIKGVKATITLKPGQSSEAEQLMTSEISCTEPDKKFIPNNGYVTKTVKDFVLAVRKVFTSIHEYKKSLSVTIDRYPDENDLSWAMTVAKSYGVEPTREYIILCPLPSNNSEAIIEIGTGDNAKEGMTLIQKSGWFIEKVEGLEEFASKEEDRPKLKAGLVFREL